MSIHLEIRPDRDDANSYPPRVKVELSDDCGYVTFIYTNPDRLIVIKREDFDRINRIIQAAGTISGT